MAKDPYIRRSLLAVSLLFPAVLQAQRYAFRHYGPADGLANQVIRTLTQDRKGFLWVGTENGLFRYDGARFVRFGAERGLPGRRITSVHQNRDGELWIGTCNGVYTRRNGHFEPVALGVSRESLGCSNIASDANGTVFVGTFAGLFALTSHEAGNRTVRVLHRSSAGSSEETPYALYVEPEGDVWFASDNHLYRFAGGKVRPLDMADGVPPDRWQAILPDRNGNLWLRSAHQTLIRPRGARQFVPLRSPVLAASDFVSLSMDREGDVFVPSDTGLWVRDNGGRWRVLTMDQGLPINGASAVLQDHEGSIWVGTQGAGLVRWLGFGEWESWTHADGLQDDSVWQLKRDRAGTLWVGTNTGLCSMTPDGRWKTWKTAADSRGGLVRGVETAPDGAIWAGFSPGGLARIEPGGGAVQRFGKSAGLGNDYILALYFDPDSTLWVGTQDGLFRSTNPGPEARFERVEIPGTNGAESFRRAIRDRQGRLWAPGTQGLAMLENGRWTRFTVRHGLRENKVGYLAEGPDGTLWVGYYEDIGISRVRYERGRFECLSNITKNNGLHSDGVVSLGSDTRGWLWVGTDEGIDVFDGRSWRHYGQSDGLIWDDCDGSSFFADRDGSVWIGTSRGLSHFRQRNRGSELPPPIAITEAMAGQTGLGTNAQSVIPYGDRSVRIGFAGLSFLNEGAMRFRYRLDGFEQGWAETEQREVRYPNLPPGEYSFQVTAVSARGVWSTEPARLDFRVSPPWWQTWWAFTLWAVLCGLAVWGVWHWRMRTVLRRQRMLERIVSRRTREIEHLLEQSKQASRLKSEFLANMSHEIRTPLNGVLGMTDLALGTTLDDEQREYLQTARSSGATLLSLLNDILDLSKIEAGRLEFDPVPFSVRDAARQVRDTLACEAREKRLALNVKVEPDVPQRLMGDPVRLRQVLLNITGNAVKFTNEGSVSIHIGLDEIRPNEVCLHLKVTDTGIGIPDEKQRVIFEPFRQADGSTTRRFGGTGLGLAISARLVEMMGGRIWVESRQGDGSTFHVTVTLAVAQEEAAAPAPDHVTPVQVGPLDILLAEDNLVNQRLAMRLLEKQGHQVTVVGNGREAVSKWESGSFDLVMLDVQMPEMDGLEAAAAIRARERETGGHTPLLALTAYAMKGDREACLDAGMDEYLSKPIEPAELFQKIALLVEGDLFAPQEIR